MFFISKEGLGSDLEEKDKNITDLLRYTNQSTMKKDSATEQYDESIDIEDNSFVRNYK